MSWPMLSLIVAVILGGGVLGVAANHWMSVESEVDSLQGALPSVQISENGGSAETAGVRSSTNPAFRIGPFNVRLTGSAAPVNPFVPAVATVAANSWPQAPQLPGLLAPGAPGAPSPPPQAAAAKEPATRIDKPPATAEILLTGVIQGEPPLAVIRFRDQSYFLKIGDLIADSWRLEEINERSCVIRHGNRRAVIPIQGGNPQ